MLFCKALSPVRETLPSIATYCLWMWITMGTLIGPIWEQSKGWGILPQEGRYVSFLLQVHWPSQRRTDFRLRISSENVIISCPHWAWLCWPSKTSPYTALHATEWVPTLNGAWRSGDSQLQIISMRGPRPRCTVQEQLDSSPSVSILICKTGMIISFWWKFEFKSISQP